MASENPELTASQLPRLCPRQMDRGSFANTALHGWRTKQLFVDVGAHDGREALDFAAMGHTVLSFEPSPKKVAHIRHRLTRDRHGGNVSLIHAALSDHVGNATFLVHGTGSEQDTLARDPLGRGKEKAVTVPLTTLDEAVGPQRRVAFLKCDAQGHDAEVLRGAARLVEERRIDVLLFEVSPRLSLADDGVRAYADLVEWLQLDGKYSCYDCPTCYPRGPLGTCRGSVFPLQRAHAARSRFAKLANYSFKVGGIEHGWWTDVVCVRNVALGVAATAREHRDSGADASPQARATSPEGQAQIPQPSGMQEPGSKCILTSWGQDGFGHQLMGRLSCEALASLNSSYAYARARHTSLEHAPPDAAALLELLNSPSGNEAHETSLVDVPHGRKYQQNCGWDIHHRVPTRPLCVPGQITLCDNCFEAVRLAGDKKEGAIRRRMAEWLRARIAAASSQGTSCAQRFDVCVHVRGVGSPGARSSKAVTSLLAERDNVRRRMRRRTKAWWLEAMGVAAELALGGDTTQRPLLQVLAHSNGEEVRGIMANVTAVRGRPVELHFANRSTPIMQMLHDLVFCCNAFVDGDSALSSAVTLATLGRTVSNLARSKELGIEFSRIVS